MIETAEAAAEVAVAKALCPRKGAPHDLMKKWVERGYCPNCLLDGRRAVTVLVAQGWKPK